MKNKLLNFLISKPSSTSAQKGNESGLQSPNAKTKVFGILTVFMMLCGIQGVFAQQHDDCPVIPRPDVDNVIICQGDPDGALENLTATCTGCEDGSDAIVTWWDHPVAQTGSGAVATGTGSILDASGIIDASIPGMKFLYAQCECGDCASERTQLMILINPAVSLDIDNITQPTCNSALSGPTGSFTVDAQGGTPPYTFVANGVAVTGAFDNLLAGTYTIAVTDANGCTDEGTVVLTEPAAFDLALAGADESCIGQGNGSITATSTNAGGLNLEYGISPNFIYQPSGDFTGLVTGTYDVTVRDANNPNCSITQSFTIGNPGDVDMALVTGYSVCVGESIPAGEGLTSDCGGNITNFYSSAGVLLSSNSPFDPIAAGLVNNNAVGTYCYMATCSDGICESPATQVCLEITVAPEPISIEGDLSVCANSAITYTALGADDSQYTWSVSGPGNFVQSQNGNIAEFVFASNATISVTETTGINCSETSTVDVVVETVSQLACRSFLNVSLGAECGAELDASIFVKDAEYGADSYAIVSAVNVDSGIDVIGSGDGYETGQTYNVMIEHACSGTRCWSTMSVEDKIAPVLSCPTTEMLGCTVDNKPVFPGDYPTATDNCCDMNSAEFFSFVDGNTIPAGSTLAAGFTGLLGPDKFALSTVNGGTAEINETIVITTDEDNGRSEASITTLFDGEICFDYDYSNEEADFERFIVSTDTADEFPFANAALNVLVDTTGSFCLNVTAGETLFFAVISDAFVGQISEATISNITYTNPDADLVDNSTCGSQFILRTWSITDCNGNVGESCDQIVFINRPSLTSIEFPDDIVIECGASVGTDPADLVGMVSDLDDEDDGLDESYPVFEGDILDEKTCFYVASHEDQFVENLCGETVKIIRTWTVTDWCSAEQVQDVQVIKVTDTTAPVILNCGGIIDVPAAAGACEGFYGIPMPELFEECSSPVTITANGLNVGDEIFIPEGGTTLTYIATDACGNSSFCDVTLNLVDGFAPVAICDANTTVSLSTFDNGLAVVCYPTFDDGSFDNCEENIVFKVKRMGTDDEFSNCVSFECGDAGETIAVRMRVYDIYEGAFDVAQADSTSYPDLDQTSRFSECMIQVQVQDKLATAEISCPTRTIECVDSFNDPSDLGGTSFPTLSDDATGIPVFCLNCPGITESDVLGYAPLSALTVVDICPETYSMTVRDNDQRGCGGEGRVTRRWELFDSSGDRIDNCSQRINVENDNHIWNPSPDGSAGTGDNADDLVNWPESVVFDCNSGTADQDVAALLEIMPDVADLVEGLEDDCASLFLSVNDEVVTNIPNACFAVIREWKIIDDCVFEPNNPSAGGFWSTTREITIIDSTAPVFAECTDRVFDVTAPNCAEVDQVGCTGFADLSVSATDLCGDDAIVYSWALDADTDGIIDQVGEGNDASGVFPVGSHSIRYEAVDGCGNVSVCEFEFKINDNKAPTPVCLVLTSTVMPSTGALEIWATDFESGSTCDNCTAYDNLEWRINKGTSRTTPPNTTNVSYDCTDEVISFGSPMDVQVWVIDEAGNADFCITQIVFTPISANDTDHPCFSGPMMLDIAGHVETEDNDMVELVDVDVSSTNTNPFSTGTSGLFSFLNVPAGGNYVVTPEKDINALNGVTTYDLVLISQHILGVNSLDSPYKIIAADANASGTVTTLDLVKIRSVILNIDQDFAPNTSWRFVDMDFVFPTPTNPFATSFPEVIAYNNLNSDELATDFVGVKIGDVNGSAVPNQLIGTTATRNVNGTLTFDTDDIKMTQGNEYTVDFTANDFTQLLGYQYSIEFDANVLELVDVKAGELTELTDANFGYSRLNEGIITTSWNSATATTMKDDAVLFSVTFNAKSNGQLSELLSATSQGVKAEAYTTNLDLLDVAFAFNTAEGTITAGESFELLQNVPNPFRGETTIGFNLEQASSATIQIMDVSGRVLKYIEGDFVRGYNEVKLNKLDLNGAGVLHYQLDTPTNTSTKKMILID